MHQLGAHWLSTTLRRALSGNEVGPKVCGAHSCQGCQHSRRGSAGLLEMHTMQWASRYQQYADKHSMIAL